MTTIKGPTTKARVDQDKTAKPRTSLVAHVRHGVCFGPGCTPEAWELRETAASKALDEEIEALSLELHGVVVNVTSQDKA